MLLAQTPSDGALGAMRQFMRQTDKFHYYYLGDITEEVIVLHCSGQHSITPPA